MKIGTIASTLVALSLGASLTACGGAEISDGSQLPGDETASGEVMSEFEPEYVQIGEAITSCDDNQYDHWRNLAALAVASANELGRWNAAKDFVKSGNGIQLSSEGLARCTNGCDNIKAILELQNDATKIIPRHDPPLLRQYLVTFFERQVSWTKTNPVPDHSLKLAAVSNDVCGFRYHFDVADTASTTTTTPPTATTGATLSGSSQIKPTTNYKCLDVSGVSSNDGALIQQWNCSFGSNQQFTIESQGNNAYRLKANNSGKCLGVVNSATHAGALLEQRSCGANNSQSFQLNPTASDANKFQLKHVASGKCVEIQGGGYNDGQLAQLNNCSGAASQTFFATFTKSGTASPGPGPGTPPAGRVKPSALLSQLKFAGEHENKFLMFQSTETQASIDPMGTMISGGSTAKSGSCVEGATAYSPDEDLTGDCCVVTKKYGKLAVYSGNKTLFYCKY